jgi:hypothetical protein
MGITRIRPAETPGGNSLSATAEPSRGGKDDPVDLVHTCARLQGDADNETQRCRLWPANTLIALGDCAAAQDELSKLFDAAKIRGEWWDPEAEERTKEFWRTVTSDEVPE